MTTIAFDVDDTLIVPASATGFEYDVPNYEVIAIFEWFQRQGHDMWIWSGGGEDYAKQWAKKLGITANLYLDKHAANENGLVPDLTFDDSDLVLGKVNIKVKRINNGVVRYYDRVKRARKLP